MEGLWLSLPSFDRDATRHPYILKVNTKSIGAIMQFSCTCGANLSTGIYKCLYYKKFKGAAKSQIRFGSNTKKHYQQGKSLKAPANKETSSDVWKDIKCNINSLNADCCCFSWDLSKSVFYFGWWILPRISAGRQCI